MRFFNADKNIAFVVTYLLPQAKNRSPSPTHLFTITYSPRQAPAVLPYSVRNHVDNTHVATITGAIAIASRQRALKGSGGGGGGEIFRRR